MEPTAAFRGLECTDCGERQREPERCRACGGPLDAVYDPDAVDVDAPAGVAEGVVGDDSTARSGALRPFRAPLSAGEGGTPLVDASSLVADVGAGRVLLKDEGHNPTGSFVDRGMALAVTAVTDGDGPVALVAPGDAGQSAAAYAGRAGLDAHVFVPSRTPFAVKAMVNVHGAEMHVVGGRYPDALAAFDGARDPDWRPLGAFTSPYRHEGAKAIAHEVAAALDWRAPDAVVVPVGTGESLVGVEKGFRELHDFGVLDAIPRLVAVQAAGCAPVVAAHERGRDAPEPTVAPDTIAGELEVPDPPGGRLALRALDRTDGDAVAVADDALLAGAVEATGSTAVEVGAAGGAAVAAARELADTFGPDDVVVLLNPAAGLKTPDVLRSHLMGQGV